MLISHIKQSASFKKLPDAIKNNVIFDQIKRIRKPFPEIGLSNCIEQCTDHQDKSITHIGFSSDKIIGMWDIATMSMRGVSSCMHWDNQHSRHLLGSLTDPFLGIIYTTDKSKTDYGFAFKKRALVRFIYDTTTKEYKLLLERTYVDTGNKDPHIYNNRDIQPLLTFSLFKNFLSKKVNNKYKIISYKELPISRNFGENLAFIPEPDSLKYLKPCNWSLSDCSIQYENLKDTFIQKFSNQVK